MFSPVQHVRAYERIVGRLRKKNQDSSYNGRDNEKIFVPFAAMARDLPRTDAPSQEVELQAHSTSKQLCRVAPASTTPFNRHPSNRAPERSAP